LLSANLPYRVEIRNKIKLNHGTTLWHKAVQNHGPLTFLDFLYNQHFGINSTDHTGRTAIYYAQDRETIKFFCDKPNFNINATDAAHRTALFHFIEQDCEELALALIQLRSDAHLHDEAAVKAGMLALVRHWLTNPIPNQNRNHLSIGYAIYHNDLEMVELLANVPEFLNAIDGRGMSPLHLAASKGKPKIIKCLLDKKSPILRDHAGKTPGDLLAERISWDKNPDLLALVQPLSVLPTPPLAAVPAGNAGRASYTNLLTELRQALHDPSLKAPQIANANAMLNYFQQHYFHPDNTFEDHTLLGHLIRLRAYGAAAILVRHEAVNVNIQGSDFESYLWMAWMGVAEGGDAVVKALLERRTHDATHQTATGYWFIHAVVAKQNRVILKVLLDKYGNDSSFDINVLNKEGKTALYIAVEKLNVEMIRDLLEAGADRNIRYKGKTPLEALQLLQRVGPDAAPFIALFNTIPERRPAIEAPASSSSASSATSCSSMSSASASYLPVFASQSSGSSSSSSSTHASPVAAPSINVGLARPPI
jgi:ankyrin repeat protein